MGSAAQTANLNLSHFADDDRPTWRGDYNGDMGKIDAAHGVLVGQLNGKEDKASLNGDIDAHLGGDSTGLVTAVAALKTHVTVGPTGAYATLNAALDAFPNGNVAIEVQAGIIAHATTYTPTASQKNVTIYGQGRDATLISCTAGLVSAPLNADQWTIRDLSITSTATTNTTDCIVVDYPRRWNIEGCTITGFGGTSIWYRGGIGSSTRRNYIQSNDVSRINGYAGIRVDLSSAGVFATTYITEQDHVASAGQYGFFFQKVNYGSCYIAPIAEYSHGVGMHFDVCMGALINPYTENNTGNAIEMNDALVTVIAPREQPVYTWTSATLAADRAPTVIGRNFINPGKGIISAPSTTTASDPTLNPSIRWGAGNPEQQQVGVKGSLWLNPDDTLSFSAAYIKTTGTGNTGWYPLTTPTYLNTALASATSSTNSRGKFAGLMAWDSFHNRPVWATGSNATDTWVYADGSIAYTPA